MKAPCAIRRFSESCLRRHVNRTVSRQNKVLATQGRITFGIWIIKESPSRVNSMKYILLASLLIVSGLSAYAQELITVGIGSGYVNSVGTLTIPAGKVAEIYAASNVTYSKATSSGSMGTSGASFAVGDAKEGCKYVGPGLFYSGNYGMLTYRLVDNVSNTTTTPTSSVVIPTDATGPVDVILESSTDLVTWTQANPGTYGASTTKRFFRVRAVNQ